MWDLITIVIPEVKAEWEYVAYSMEYDIATVKAIKKDCRDDKECCETLFEDWLSTDHGAAPKTWSTLLQKIRDVDSLAAAVDDIKRQLSGMAQSYSYCNTLLHACVHCCFSDYLTR